MPKAENETTRTPETSAHSARGGATRRARTRERFRWRTDHGVPRPMARRGSETPVELRLDVWRDVHERPALARHVLPVRRGEQAKCQRDAREAAAWAGTRDTAGKIPAVTRERGRARGHRPSLPPRHPLQTPHRSTPRVECLPVFLSRPRALLRVSIFAADNKAAEARNVEGRAPIETAERQRRFFTFSLRVSYERQSRKSLRSFRNFDASRDISVLTASRWHSTALARRVFSNATLARRSLAEACRPSRSTTFLSNFYVRCRSSLGCAQSPQTAPFQGNSEVSCLRC